MQTRTNQPFSSPCETLGQCIPTIRKREFDAFQHLATTCLCVCTDCICKIIYAHVYMSNMNMHVNHCILFLAVLQYTLNASNQSLEVICPLQVTVNSCEPLGHPNKWGTTNLVPAAYLLHLEALQQTPSRYVPQIATACYHTKKQRLKELSSKGCRFTQSKRSENLQTPGCLTKRQPGCLKAFRPKANPPRKKTVETSDITPTNGLFLGNWGFITPIYGRLRNPTCTTARILNLP